MIRISLNFASTLVQKSASTILSLVRGVLSLSDFYDWGYYVLLLEVLFHLLRNLVECLLHSLPSFRTHLHEKYSAVLRGKFLGQFLTLFYTHRPIILKVLFVSKDYLRDPRGRLLADLDDPLVQVIERRSVIEGVG